MRSAGDPSPARVKYGFINGPRGIIESSVKCACLSLTSKYFADKMFKAVNATIEEIDRFTAGTHHKHGEGEREYYPPDTVSSLSSI